MDDLDAWQEAFEADLTVDARGSLGYDSPTLHPATPADERASDQVLSVGAGDPGAVRSAAATVSTYHRWNRSGGQPRWRTSQW